MYETASFHSAGLHYGIFYNHRTYVRQCECECGFLYRHITCRGVALCIQAVCLGHSASNGVAQHVD